MRFRSRLFGVVLAATLVSAGASADEPVRTDAACAPGWESDLFTAARGSVVRIINGDGFGAGFVWKSSRQIVTAMHVVEGARSFDIVFGDGSKGRARITTGDRTSDLAILTLEGRAPDLRPLELGDPASLPLGAPVVAIGHPFAGDTTETREEGLKTWTITRGVLGARNDHQIQVDAQLNPGNSGGPILDCTGRVIGVASHIAGTIGFASSPREILELDHSPRLPGLSFAPTSAALRLGLSLRVASFTSYGPLVDFDFAFFEKLHLMARMTGLFNLTTAVDGDRAITSRSGAQLYAGAGYAFRIWRLRLLPHVGVAAIMVRENAITITNGRPRDTSSDESSVRFTPGLSLTGLRFTLDYRVELDFGEAGDSAHLFSASMRFW